MTSFPRHQAAVLRQRASQYPVVTVTGPRQAGKTTLCRQGFPQLPYVNLERPDLREFAQADAQGFLRRYRDGAVFDEIQHVPALLSWIQAEVDERPRPGAFILTGSHSFELMAGVTQSLAGRTALLNLLPLSVNELQDAGLHLGTDAMLHRGGYPRIHADGLDPAVALGDYFATYVERDLRQLIELRNLDQFRRFVRMCAGRTGQILNLASLAGDVGVSGHTARAWLSLLESSFVVRLLTPWFANIGKRLVKAPKLYFCDVGLAAWLIGITEERQLTNHPLRGALFETLVVMEFVKHALHHGQPAQLHYYRDSAGLEVDLLVAYGLPPGQLGLVEVKAGQTFQPEHLQPMRRVAALLGERVGRQMLVNGGDQLWWRDGVELVGLHARAGALA